jgi:hypothetical protein
MVLELNIVPPTLSRGLNMEIAVKRMSAEKLVSVPSPATRGNGKLRLGLMSPGFPRVRVEPTDVADNGRVRLGLMSPSFPRSRIR